MSHDHDPPRRPPVFLLDLHYVCNLSCSYCTTEAGPRQDFGPILDPSRRRTVLDFFNRNGPYNVVLSGGEPLITPGIFDLIGDLTAAGHLVSLQTNLRTGAEELIRRVAPDGAGWLLISIHSVALDSLPAMERRIMALRDAGFPMAVKLVLDEPMLPRFAPIFDRLADSGVGVMLSPIIDISDRYDLKVIGYAPPHGGEIESRMTLLSSWLFFAGGLSSAGMACLAGSRLFYGAFARDPIHGCSDSHPENLGAFTAERFDPQPGPIECRRRRCICDFHYYTGAVPAADDSEAFEELVRGRFRVVSRREFKDWVAARGLRPVIPPDLVLRQSDPAGSGRLSRLARLLRMIGL